MSEGVLEANGGLPGQYIDGIIDIIGESHNVQMYYQNEILRQILFNKNELTSEQMRTHIFIWKFAPRKGYDRQKSVCKACNVRIYTLNMPHKVVRKLPEKTVAF